LFIAYTVYIKVSNKTEYIHIYRYISRFLDPAGSIFPLELRQSAGKVALLQKKP